MSELIVFPCIIPTVTMLANRDMKVTARTAKELDPLEMAIILDMGGRIGHLGFRESDIKEEDFNIPDEKPEFNTKTSAQRLRSVLYLLWKQQGEKGEFELYYRISVEHLIDEIKGKLD